MELDDGRQAARPPYSMREDRTPPASLRFFLEHPIPKV